MSEAADLLSASRTFYAEQFSATVLIAGQSYAAGTSGKRSGSTLGHGGFTKTKIISFWISAAAVLAAGQSAPAEDNAVIVTDPPAFAGTYVIDTIATDSGGGTYILRCIETPQ
jgi:hypothetical protein